MPYIEADDIQTVGVIITYHTYIERTHFSSLADVLSITISQR